MIHPNVTPESDNGPASDAPAAPAEPGHAPRMEGGDAAPGEPPTPLPEAPAPHVNESLVEASSQSAAASPPEVPIDHGNAAPPASEPSTDVPAPSLESGLPGGITPPDPPKPVKELVPIDVVRRMEARIRRLEHVVSALVKRQRKPAKLAAAPIAQPPMPEWKPSATPAPVKSPDVEPFAPPVPAPPAAPIPVSPSVSVSAPPPVLMQPPAPEPPIPLVAPAPPPPELAHPPVAAIIPEIPVASLASAPPVASLAPPEAPAPAAPVTENPSLRDRLVAAGQRVLSSPAASQAMAAAAVPMARVAVALATAPAGTPTHPFRHPWIVMEAYNELRGVIRMYRDRSYRPGLYAWLIPVVALSFMICSYFFVGMTIPWVGPFLDKLIDFALAYVAYKAMVREAERYELQRPRPA